MCIPSPSPESRFFSGFFREGDFPAEERGRARVESSRHWAGFELRCESHPGVTTAAKPLFRFVSARLFRRDWHRYPRSPSRDRQGDAAGGPVLHRQSIKPPAGSVPGCSADPCAGSKQGIAAVDALVPTLKPENRAASETSGRRCFLYPFWCPAWCQSDWVSRTLR